MFTKYSCEQHIFPTLRWALVTSIKKRKGQRSTTPKPLLALWLRSTYDATPPSLYFSTQRPEPELTRHTPTVVALRRSGSGYQQLQGTKHAWPDQAEADTDWFSCCAQASKPNHGVRLVRSLKINNVHWSTCHALVGRSRHMLAISSDRLDSIPYTLRKWTRGNNTQATCARHLISSVSADSST
jgi:hypothetical protein